MTDQESIPAWLVITIIIGAAAYLLICDGWGKALLNYIGVCHVEENQSTTQVDRDCDADTGDAEEVARVIGENTRVERETR